MSIQNKGITAYVQRRYIKEGKKEIGEQIWNIARILLPLGALILSILTAINNKTLSDRIKTIEDKISTKK